MSLLPGHRTTHCPEGSARRTGSAKKHCLAQRIWAPSWSSIWTGTPNSSPKKTSQGGSNIGLYQFPQMHRLMGVRSPGMIVTSSDRSYGVRHGEQQGGHPGVGSPLVGRCNRQGPPRHRRRLVRPRRCDARRSEAPAGSRALSIARSARSLGRPSIDYNWLTLG